MTAIVQDLVIEQGATFEQLVSIVDESGLPLDLTDYTLTMVISTWRGGHVIATLTEADGITNNGAAANATIKIADEVTSEYMTRYFGSAVYDIYAEHSSGDRFRTNEGRVTLNPKAG